MWAGRTIYGVSKKHKDTVVVNGKKHLFNHMEVINVNNDGIRGLSLIARVEFFGIAVEELPIVQPCKLVLLGAAYQAAVVGQFDYASYPRLHYLRHGIWFGNEVDRTLVQALDL